jgi:osmoprotectant transport system substrate-binding protein
MALLVVLTLTAACGGQVSEGPDSAEEGPTDGDAGLEGAELTVGSDNYTEQLILGHIAVTALEDAGASVSDQIGLAGTAVVREAAVTGEIDLYWEYTGTAWISFLDETEPIADPEEQYEAVAERDREENDLVWLDPTPFNNTYQIAVREEAYDELGVETISDLGQLVEDSPEEATLCVGPEFSTRDDGLPGMEAYYGFEFPEENLSLLDDGVIYNEVDSGGACNFGVVFATDGRIEGLDLVTLEDDEQFFPSYNAAVVVREESFEQYPQLEELFAPIAAALDTETMRALNLRVDFDGELPEVVAEDWLRDEGLVS